MTASTERFQMLNYLCNNSTWILLLNFVIELCYCYWAVSIIINLGYCYSTLLLNCYWLHYCYWTFSIIIELGYCYWFLLIELASFDLVVVNFYFVNWTLLSSNFVNSTLIFIVSFAIVNIIYSRMILVDCKKITMKYKLINSTK